MSPDVTRERILASTPDELQSRLINAANGGAAYDAYQELAKLAKGRRRSDALTVLIDYARSGRYDHIRQFITSDLAHSAAAGDVVLLPFFKEGLGDPVRGYWSILGYVRVAEADAYHDLVGLLLDTRLPLNQRAHAAKCLAQHSGQRFDRDASSDPGFWSEQHIRVAEIRAWLDGGCAPGPGYDEPGRDPALDSPATTFERLVAKLDGKLAKSRKQHQDLAEPTNWLTPASPRDLARIKERWRLPSVYLDFLTRFSPLRVIIGDSDIFVQNFFLFGAADLIAGQDGYSESSILKRRLEEWPAHLVVIGSDGGDPYVLDLARSNGEDAPVLTAWHGQGSWDFQPVVDSFVEFLEVLVAE
jgi:hypothetical protein